MIHGKGFRALVYVSVCVDIGVHVVGYLSIYLSRKNSYKISKRKIKQRK